VSRQRFCPLCDRSFEDGEAVLRCNGCGVLHHPACWVRNDGCATVGEHESSPLAEAYVNGGPGTSPAPHPAEGTRILNPARIALPPQRLAVQREVPSREAASPISGPDDDGPVIGDYDPPASERQPVIGAPQARQARPSDPQTPYRPTPPRRYQPDPESAPVRKPLPKVYGRHRAMDYWYVPVAVALAVVVALGVVWVADRMLGSSDSDGDTNASDLPSETQTAGAGGPGTTPGSATSATTPTDTTPPPAGTFRPGDVVVVSGSGECLNVRPSPGLDNDPVACLPDGSEFEILGGPQTTGDLTWWHVQTAQGEGWAAEDYLVRRQ